ncbi:ABC transporter permease [Pseudomonas putida]|uniref:ABC transporter permease n=1 Tax=Pseudomonas putida group TaxID=136845 RepID=UPI0018A98E5D|nr:MULTISPECIES: ABC transporter permease [Pseudomonas putida group]MBF8651247.1 ABC transporter permease [Pseudomonas putida]MBF8654943.1 ABC transporter permease [Pseudomonas putida]MBF8680129.1 ABC transporter permease [Pseudomonas fulva]MBF8718563.1 ABC transporter permease [Pseudomonas fulva]MBF8783638.1 ABC transporter permease [Pseudomonas fulva]
MNPHSRAPIAPWALVSNLWHHRRLILQMSRREVIGRYKGSVMGILWSFLNPLFMLAVYTFVFSVVFKARWTTSPGEDKADFAVLLFAGMIVHTLLAEVLNRAPGLIMANVNYVKKVVFPLEILPVVSMCAALFHCAISLLVLLCAIIVLDGNLSLSMLLVPVVLLPYVIFVQGLAWILASLGVFLRDVGQTIGIITMVLLFLSPVFFPVSSLPEELRPLMNANPLTFIIEQVREVLIWGHMPDWAGLGLYAIMALFTAWLGYAWFQRTRKGFADVL